MRCEYDTPRKERISHRYQIIVWQIPYYFDFGAGSSGTVYLAEHLKLKVYRAIKCIPKDTARNTSNFSEEQLLKEAGLLKNLNHPGIPSYMISTKTIIFLYDRRIYSG